MFKLHVRFNTSILPLRVRPSQITCLFMCRLPIEIYFKIGVSQRSQEKNPSIPFLNIYARSFIQGMQLLNSTTCDRLKKAFAFEREVRTLELESEIAKLLKELG